MRPTAAEQGGGGTERPVELAHGQGGRHLCRAELPGLVPLVDARLVGLGLVASQVREDAGENRWWSPACQEPVSLLNGVLARPSVRTVTRRSWRAKTH
jgi:hypothetical protein